MVVANVIKKSRRVSRLELRLNDDELEIIRDSDLGLWRVNQHRGPSNQDVSKELKDLAQFILNKYNRAYDKIIQEQEEKNKEAAKYILIENHERCLNEVA